MPGASGSHRGGSDAAGKRLYASCPVYVIGFKDEEGNRFGYGMVGSRSICGRIEPEGLSSCDRDGISLKDAMTAYGLDPSRLRTAGFFPYGHAGASYRAGEACWKIPAAPSVSWRELPVWNGIPYGSRVTRPRRSHAHGRTSGPGDRHEQVDS